MHPVIAELCTALGTQIPILSWFATVLFIVMFLFSFQVNVFLVWKGLSVIFDLMHGQAIMLFGQNVVTCSDFGKAAE
jgi:hypothetical protein